MVARHTKTYDQFPIIFLLEEAVLLLEYKTWIQENDRVGAPSCSTSVLCGQILNVVYLFGEKAVNHWNDLVATSSEFCDEQLSMGGPKKENLEVVEWDPPQVFGEGQIFFFDFCWFLTNMAEPCSDYGQLGTTHFDIAFFKFSTKFSVWIGRPIPGSNRHVNFYLWQWIIDYMFLTFMLS